MSKTERGFEWYADEDGVSVSQSSRAAFPYHVWVRGGRYAEEKGIHGALHLSPAQAKIALRGLQAYVDALPPESEWEVEE